MVMKCGIVGYGHVGMAMHKRFTDALIYDEPPKIGSREEINNCDVAFICVPTPMGDNGECDTSIVENVLEWVKSSTIVIRSTVPVGFTKYMVRKTGKIIAFQPEYYGETVDHPFADLSNQKWISIGGDNFAVNATMNFYQERVNSEIRFYTADSDTVELAKYMENAYLATKVVFCNEMYDLAKKMGINYNQAREIWLADPRIGRSHTFVFPDNRGFGGSCLPKDTRALVAMGRHYKSDMTLLDCVIRKNEILRGDRDEHNIK